MEKVVAAGNLILNFLNKKKFIHTNNKITKCVFIYGIKNLFVNIAAPIHSCLLVRGIAPITILTLIRKPTPLIKCTQNNLCFI